jgi:hypothetical protein
MFFGHLMASDSFIRKWKLEKMGLGCTMIIPNFLILGPGCVIIIPFFYFRSWLRHNYLKLLNLGPSYDLIVPNFLYLDPGCAIIIPIF